VLALNRKTVGCDNDQHGTVHELGLANEGTGESQDAAILSGLRSVSGVGGTAMDQALQVVEDAIGEANSNGEFLKSQDDWRRRADVWLRVDVADEATLESRRARAIESFSRDLDQPTTSARNQEERIRRALSSAFGANAYSRSRIGLPLSFMLDPQERGDCASGLPMLRQWNSAMNDYPGNWRMVELLSTPDRGFGKMLEDVTNSLHERVTAIGKLAKRAAEPVAKHAVAILEAETPRTRDIAMKEFRAREADQFAAAVRVLSEGVVLSEVLEAFGGDRDEILHARSSIAECAVALCEASYIGKRVEAAVIESSAVAVGKRCGEGIREMYKGFPGFKDVVGNRATDSCDHLVLDVQTGDQPALRIFINRAAAKQERVERLLQALRRLDEMPRSGYAAMNYRPKTRGDQDDTAVRQYLQRSAQWTSYDDGEATLMGVIPGEAPGDALAVIKPKEDVGRRAYLMPAIVPQLVHYFVTPDRVCLSGYRPQGRFVTFYSGNVAVAHGWARPEIAEGIAFGDAAIRAAEEVLLQNSQR